MSKQTMPTPKTSRQVETSAQSRASSATRTKSQMQPGRDRRRIAAQTASFEGKRDRKPVILNYGRDLLPAQKTRMQRRLYYTFATIMIVAVLGILGYGWLDFNVIQPGEPIVTVNGHQIPQREYRYMVAYLAQDTWNKLQAANAQQNTLNMEVNMEKDATKKKALQDQLNSVQVQISSYQSAFTQNQVDQQAIDWLIEDQLIQQYENANPAAKAKASVSSQQLNDAYSAFGKNFPHGQSLSNFLNKDNMSADNLKFAISVVLRRHAMDQYQQSLITTPQRQVHIEKIQVDALPKAQADLTKLQQHPDQWNAVAKADSLDTNSGAKGGDMGWVIYGQQDQAIEQWAFDPARKVGDMSGVIKDVGGTYNIVKVLEIDNSRTVDKDTLANLKSNALSHWLTGLRDLPPTKISATNQDMFNSTYNVPSMPNLNVTFPGQSSSSGLPNSGIPGMTP